MADRQPRPIPSFRIAADRVFDGEAMLGPRILAIEDGRITGIFAEGEGPAGPPVTRLAPRAILAPGFIDIQVNGGGGVLLNDDPTPGTIGRIAAAHRRFGTTGLLPTLMSDRREKLALLAEAAGEAASIPGILGFHLEGPFLNLPRRGIHAFEHIRVPTRTDIDLLLRFAGIGRSIVTLAPEIVPVDAIHTLLRAGLGVSLGHSDAAARVAAVAADVGARGVTHLFNAMSQIAPREPGLVGAALADQRLFAGLIVDGIHVDPINIALAFRLKGRDRLMLVSDAMPTVGSNRDWFQIGAMRITLAEGRLTNDAGTLAGAHLAMIDAVRNAAALPGIALEDALVMASRTPAEFLGMGDERGRIAPGYRADLVAFDERYKVLETWIDGVDSAGPD